MTFSEQLLAFRPVTWSPLIAPNTGAPICEELADETRSDRGPDEQVPPPGGGADVVVLGVVVICVADLGEQGLARRAPAYVVGQGGCSRAILWKMAAATRPRSRRREVRQAAR
jgi:hypothetical protein